MKTKTKKLFSVLLSLLLTISSFSGLFIETYASGNLKLKGVKNLTGNQSLDIVSVAQANVSRTGKQVGAYQHWCVDFVSSCARKANISTDIIPDGGNVSYFKQALLATGAKQVSSPKAGDLVFYGPSHVGIMADTVNSYQGNFSGKGSGSAFWNSSKVLYCKYTSCSNYTKYGATFIRPKYKKAANVLSVNYLAGGADVTSKRYCVLSDVICTSDGEAFTEKRTYNKETKDGLRDASSFGLKKAGYTFSGWENSKGKIFSQEDASVLPSQIDERIKKKSCTAKLTAVWQANTLTVHYNANGGKLSSEKYTLDKSKGNILLKGTDKLFAQKWVYNEKKQGGLRNASSFSLKRKGYKFIGWSTKKNGENIFSQSDETLRPTDLCPEITENNAEITMYAVWEMNHDHVETQDKAVKPTCTKDGLTSGTHCKECGFIITKQKRVPALGHDFSEETVIDKQPTCTKSGSSSRHCIRCNEVTDVKKIDATNHDYGSDSLKAATTQADGSISGKCTVCADTKKKETIARISDVSLSQTSYTYNEKIQKPTVTVKDSKGKALLKGTDYSVKYYTPDSRMPGKYLVKVTFKGKYSGTVKLSYKIAPKQVNPVIVSSDVSKQIKIRYPEYSEVTGYEIYVSTSQYGKYKKLCSTKQTSYTAKKLTSGKTYYFKVRAYKTVSGKNIYGEFSKIYCAKTK